MRRSALISGLGLMAAGCGSGPATEQPIEQPRPAPVLLALDTYSAPLGTPVGVYGAQFPNAPNKHNRKPLALLKFDGVFEAHDGAASEVATSAVLHRKSDGTLVWDSLGPFQNPFTRREAIGTFDGTAKVEFYDVGQDGLARDLLAATPAQPLRFTVEPSIFIRRFRPLDSRCTDPVPSALPYLPYEIEVAAVGRDMRSFTFAMTADYPAFDDGKAPAPAPPVRVDVPAELNLARAGQNTVFITPPMPYGMTNYLLKLDVTGHAVDGHDVHNFAALVVHNPIAVYSVGPRQLAQTYDPVIQGKCFQPGVSTSHIEYSETRSETRTVSSETSFSTEWGASVESGVSQAIGETRSSSTSYAVSQGTSSTDGTTSSFESHWRTGVATSFEGEVGGGIFGFPKATVGLEVNNEYGERSGFATTRTQGRTDERTAETSQTLGVNRSATTSETLSRNLSEGSTKAEAYTVTSTDSTSQGYEAEIFPDTAAVWYSQLSRYTTEAIVVRYNLCGQEEPIGNSMRNDWSWAVDVSYGTTCTPVPAPDDFEPGRCILGSCEEGEAL